LCANTFIPIAYGESERSEKVFPSIIEAGVRHLQPIAGHMLSIKEFLSIANLAEHKNLDLTAGGSSYYNAQFVSAAGKNALLEFLEPVVGLLDTITVAIPKVKKGQFILSEEPGLGVIINWEKLRKEKKITNDATWT